MSFTGDFVAATARSSGRRRSLDLWAACAGAVLALACAAVPASGQVAAPAGPAAAVPTLREGVAALVNDEIISTYDLRQRMLLLIVTSGVQVTEQNLPQIQAEALRDLIDERLQMQEVRRIEERTKSTLEPTKAELTEQVDHLAQQNGLSGQQMVASLAQAGVDERALTGQLQAEIAWQRYVGGRFGGTVKIGEDQIQAALKRAEAAQSRTQYQVGEIFIDSQRAGSEAAAMDGARALAQQLTQGAPFANVARQFSAAPSAAAGGDAGWMVSGDMPPAIEAALEQLRPGQLSPPVPVNGGVYLLLLRDKRTGVGATLVSLKQAAVRLAADAPPADVAAAQAKLEALRPKIASCKAMDAEAGKVAGVVAGDLGEADINDLSASFRDAIANLKVDQVSAPVRTNAGLHLVALCGKRSGGANQLSREDVENRLTEQELVMIARRELRNLRNSASIENR
ncbi:MAG TPA: peptidylprolyl isomerase [Caulobacteraceae bacterium]|jgi:peptidyl-prolyl cis-trans isomerase SurA|nr:peptidylprolyl isomerase [Caulobacteraceae bacterium]